RLRHTDRGVRRRRAPGVGGTRPERRDLRAERPRRARQGMPPGYRTGACAGHGGALSRLGRALRLGRRPRPTVRGHLPRLKPPAAKTFTLLRCREPHDASPTVVLATRPLNEREANARVN